MSELFNDFPDHIKTNKDAVDYIKFHNSVCDVKNISPLYHPFETRMKPIINCPVPLHVDLLIEKNKYVNKRG